MKIHDFVQLNGNWRNLVISNTTLEKGNTYYRQQLVKLTACEKKDDMLMLKAQVKSASSRKKYNVAMTFNKVGEVSQYECDCPAYANYDGLCKHCVAALLAYNSFFTHAVEPRLEAMGLSRQESAESPQTPAQTNSRGSVADRSEETAYQKSVSDDYERQRRQQIEAAQARQMQLAVRRSANVLSAYKQIVENEVRENGAGGHNREITLVPVLDISDPHHGLLLSFQVRRRSEQEIAGDALRSNSSTDTRVLPSAVSQPERVPANQFPRAYVIKSIDEFMRSTVRHERVYFGQGLSFKALDATFDETSLRWIAFTQRRYSECMRITLTYYAQKDRRVKLTDAALDELFELFADAWFRVGDSSPEYLKLISQETPELVVTLGKNDDGAVTLSCDQMDCIYMGIERTNAPGVSWGSEEKRAATSPRHIYMVHEGRLRRFSASASSILTPLLLGIMDTQGVLTFLPQQTADLFAHVLPEVSKYIRVNDPLGLMKQSGVDEMTGRILLDAPDKDHVSAILLAGYHGIWLDTHSGQAVGQSAAHADGGASTEMNWDVADVDVSQIKRDYHTEQRFLAQTGAILGFQQEDILSFLAMDKNGAGAANTSEHPMTITGNDRIYQLLTDGIAKLQSTCDVLVTQRMRNLSVEPPKKITVGVTLNSGLLKLNIDTGGIDLDEMRELMRAYHEKKRYYRLKNGQFVDFNSGNADAYNGMDELRKVEQGLQLSESDVLDGEVEVPMFRALYLDGLFSDAVSLGYSKDQAFKELTERIRNFAHAENCVPKSLENVLRPYQKAGYQWMRCLESCSFCGILADDMGLGKSVQLLSVLLAHYGEDADKGDACRARRNAKGSKHADEAADHENTLPSLIACPSSLVLNWKKEAEKFAPTLSVRVIQGTQAARRERIAHIQNRELVITSYDLLKRDVDAYKNFQFHYFAIDEAQYIKNHTTQAAKAVKKVNCKQRFALTGTPIENRLSELWSIFDFLMPGYLYNYNRFKQQFETPIAKNGDETAKSNLRRMILPFVLRRLKSDVLTELPPKTTTIVPVELNEKQMELYKAMLLTGLQSLKNNADKPTSVAKMQVLALLTKLRRLCCDPSLCFDTFKYGSAKLDACMELLEQAKEGGHKVLLFSQYTDMLSLIEARVQEAGISSLRLQGSTAVKDRLSLVDQFNQGETDVFLISLKAGGTGLNLTAADTVIHYDPWWNLAAQDQATDRAYRIGQDKKVQVYKLIAQDTMEEKILKLQDMKKDLAAIVENDSDEGDLMHMSTDEIVDLLKDRG